ncbi:MAG: hypothetical protein CSA72_01605 [Rhodobacterales bacterium]|nr:MAG: hypothetical protein CSA72_01605 [Rhodobacterales bacterium]
MLPDFRTRSVTEFRTQISEEIRWIDRHGAHLWLTRHGRKIAAVVPPHHMAVLEAALGKPLDQHRLTMEERLRQLERAAAARRTLEETGRWR